MLKRTIEVSTEGTHLSLRDKQLIIARDRETLATVPFEDLGFLVLDSRGVTITSSALRAASEAGAVVVVCADNHIPSALMMPLEGNALHTQRLLKQVSISEPLRKRLWARIVRAKIQMQAALLERDSTARARLESLADRIKSGDAENLEAQAARLYWPEVFKAVDLPEPFWRDRNGPPPNGLLNYGYALVRASVARALCAAGLHPALGLQHHNRSNAFCLADDLVEPFRPVVDARVKELCSQGKLEVNKDTKKPLLEILTTALSVGEETGPLMNGTQRAATSLWRAIDVGTGEGKQGAEEAADLLELPRL